MSARREGEAYGIAVTLNSGREICGDYYDFPDAGNVLKMEPYIDPELKADGPGPSPNGSRSPLFVSIKNIAALGIIRF